MNLGYLVAFAMTCGKKCHPHVGGLTRHGARADLQLVAGVSHRLHRSLLGPGSGCCGVCRTRGPCQRGANGGVGNSLGFIKDPAGVPELSLTVSHDIRKIFQSEPWSLTSVFVFSR